MKRISIFCLFIMLLVPALPGVAALVGNPVGFPDGGGFSFGLEYQNMDKKPVFEYDDMHENEIELDYSALRVSYGVTDFLAVDFRVGRANYTWLTSRGEEDGTEWDYGSMWGLGARALLYESDEGLKMMSGVQYNSYSPDDAKRNRMLFEAENNDLSVSVDISQQFADRITLFGGIQHSDSTDKFFHEGEFGRREGGHEQDKEWGLYGGFDVELLDGLSFYVEGHAGNEKSYLLGLMYTMGLGKAEDGTAPEDGVVPEDGIIPEEKPPSVPPPDFEEELVPTGSSDMFSGRLNFGVEYTRITDRKMMEIGGFVPLYDSYRMESGRTFLTVSYDVIEKMAVFVKLGKASLDTHSSEGETTEFDSEFAFGIGASGTLIEFENGMWLSGEISYLSFDPEDENTVSTAKEWLKTPGDVSLEWSEFDISFDISKQIENTRLFGGFSFTKISADQNRELDDGTIIISEFDAEDELGLFVGVEQALAENFNVMFRVGFVDAREYIFAGEFSF